MDSWIAPDLPTLPPPGVELALYDSARRDVIPSPAQPSPLMTTVTSMAAWFLRRSAQARLPAHRDRIEP